MASIPYHYRAFALRDYAAGMMVKLICHKWRVSRSQFHEWRKQAGAPLRCPQKTNPKHALIPRL